MLTDDEIEFAAKTKGVSWTGYREDAFGFYTIPVLSPYHYQFARAIEAAVFTMANVLADSRARRIATLESTLRVALEVLSINQYAVADQAPHKDVMNYNALIEKIEEVL